MTTQHTPGPWTAKCYLRPDLDDDPMGIYAVRTADDALTPRYYAADPETVAGMDELNAIHAENAANACLIAASPKLLVLLEQAEAIIRQLDRPRVGKFWLPNFLAGVRYEIGKAKGELRK